MYFSFPPLYLSYHTQPVQSRISILWILIGTCELLQKECCFIVMQILWMDTGDPEKEDLLSKKKEEGDLNCQDIHGELDI